MLKSATQLMSLYATLSIGWALNDLLRLGQLEAWATVGVIAFSLLLILAAILVRARVPGGVPVAAAALLGLQALDVHNASHLGTGLWWQALRAVAGLVMLGLAVFGGLPRKRPDERRPDRPPPSQPARPA